MEDILKKSLTFIFIFTLIVVRIFIPDDKSGWISIIGYIGVIIAFQDIYIKAQRLYGKIDRFNSIRGAAFLTGGILLILFVLISFGIIILNKKADDLLSLFALLLSLPNDLYILLIKRYVEKKE